MDATLELLNLDNITGIIIGVFIIMSGITGIVNIIGRFSEIINKPLKWVKRKNEDHLLLSQTMEDLKTLKNSHEKSVQQSILHDEMLKKDLSNLTDTVNGIVTTLNEMEEKNNETEIKKLKDRLIRYYNKYKNIGEWSKIEKDAFWDLFEDYEARGGDGYIHSIVEPVMRDLKEIDY